MRHVVVAQVQEAVHIKTRNRLLVEEGVVEDKEVNINNGRVGS